MGSVRFHYIARTFLSATIGCVVRRGVFSAAVVYFGLGCTPGEQALEARSVERLVFIVVVIGIVVMVALDFLVLEPTLGHTYFFYVTVLVCVFAVAWLARWLWRLNKRR